MLSKIAAVVTKFNTGRQWNFRTRQKEVHGSGERCFLSSDFLEVALEQAPVRATFRDRPDGCRAPKRMNEAQAAEINPQRQFEEPSCPFQRFLRADPEAIAEAAMLRPVLVISGSQRAAQVIDAMKQNRVQFVVAHDR